MAQYCNMKEFSIFLYLQVFYPYFELCMAEKKWLEEMSIDLTENLLVIFQLFFYGFFFLTVYKNVKIWINSKYSNDTKITLLDAI